jgi:hypothetical protein
MCEAMEEIRTQFMMSGVSTYVTVQKLAGDLYGCVLNLADFFEGDEHPVDRHDHDMILKRNGKGQWEISGDPKIELDNEDLQSLGKAIEEVAA